MSTFFDEIHQYYWDVQRTRKIKEEIQYMQNVMNSFN